MNLEAALKRSEPPPIAGVTLVDLSSSSSDESCAGDADAESAAGKRLRVPGDAAAESTEASCGGVTQRCNPGNAEAARNSSEIAEHAESPAGKRARVSAVEAERSAAPGHAAPAGNRGKKDDDLMRRLRKTPRSEVRYRLFRSTAVLDEVLEARLTEHLGFVFDYTPLAHGWLSKCWA